MTTMGSLAAVISPCRPITGIVLAAGIAFAAPSTVCAQQRFQTPNEATSALVDAVRAGRPDAIVRVLGQGGRDIASSGDSVADVDIRKRFLTAYDQKNQIELEGDNKAILIVGREDFPFPIPLIRRNERWRFDTTAGRQEILFRRIGRNELHAIQAALAYVDAQFEYAEKDRTGAGAGVYARRFVSRPGTMDGLYWPTAAGEQPSPLGDLVAQATSEGYRLESGPRAPFHGYFYRILTRQGPAARGGTMNYIVRGKMIGGFALIAYPAIYRNSGVMTFMVNHDGVVFENDLGRGTTGIAARTYSFNPDPASWTKAKDVAPIQTLMLMR